jgi:hypothetical protein
LSFAELNEVLCARVGGMGIIYQSLMKNLQNMEKSLACVNMKYISHGRICGSAAYEQKVESSAF